MWNLIDMGEPSVSGRYSVSVGDDDEMTDWYLSRSEGSVKQLGAMTNQFLTVVLSQHFLQILQNVMQSSSRLL